MSPVTAILFIYIAGAVEIKMCLITYKKVSFDNLVIRMNQRTKCNILIIAWSFISWGIAILYGWKFMLSNILLVLWSFKPRTEACLTADFFGLAITEFLYLSSLPLLQAVFSLPLDLSSILTKFPKPIIQLQTIFT